MDIVNFNSLGEATIAAQNGDIPNGATVYIPNSPIMVCVNNELKEFNSQAEFKMSVYEMNKQIYSQMPIKTDEELEELKEIINDFRKKIDDTHRIMLLCNHLRYYTIFENYIPQVKEAEFETLGDGVVECAQEVGEILDIFSKDEESIEIWIKHPKAGAIVMYVFDCEGMFVSYRGY